MDKNIVKEKLQKGEPSVGIFMELDHPGVASLVAQSGFDWMIFDTEHGHYTTETLRSVLNAVGEKKVSPIIRVPGNDANTLKVALDIGPQGVIIPMVSSEEECRAAVAGCKYPPEGIRGIGPSRATGYGTNLSEYLDKANDNTLVIIQIETVEAVKNIDKIAKVKGVDVLFIGALDLSGSMGITGQTNHPDLVKAIDKVIETGKREGVPIGMWCRNEEHAAEMHSKGVQFLAYTTDSLLLASSAKNSAHKVKELLDKAK